MSLNRSDCSKDQFVTV